MELAFVVVLVVTLQQYMAESHKGAINRTGPVINNNERTFQRSPAERTIRWKSRGNCPFLIQAGRAIVKPRLIAIDLVWKLICGEVF